MPADASSFHPPTLSEDQGHDAPPGFVLLDTEGYIADRRNATTATAVTSHGQTILVTFHTARPPLLSHVCVHCPTVEPAAFPFEPKVVRAEADLILLRISVHPLAQYHITYRDYFVYKAHPAHPTLDLLPNPYPHLFAYDEAGLLRLSDDDYIVAALNARTLHGAPIPMDRLLHETDFNLYMYRHKANKKGWTRKVVLLDRPLKEQPAPDPDGCAPYHDTNMVITLGGSGGMLGWVDLRRGILLCKVLDEYPVLSYLPLPPPASGNRDTYLHLCPHATRNITVTRCKDSIKYIEMEKLPHHGWKAITWSMPNPAVSSYYDNWRLDNSVHFANLTLDNPGHSELLPKLHGDEAVTKATLGRLAMSYPAISISDGVVYFFSRAPDRYKSEALVAVDMGEKALQGVARLAVRDNLMFGHIYCTSEISKYLKSKKKTKKTMGTGESLKQSLVHKRKKCVPC